jgi:hypothetical protein
MILCLQFATRFYSRTVAVIGLLVVAHLACFIASVVMLDAQKQFIDEVDDAGVSCIAMHRMAIDCRYVVMGVVDVVDIIIIIIIRKGPLSPHNAIGFLPLAPRPVRAAPSAALTHTPGHGCP